MVKLHVKKADESLFLFETKLTETTDRVIDSVTHIYNGCLKVRRICSEFEELANHGTFLPMNMQGLTDEQIEELRLNDDWGDKCAADGYEFNRDPVGRRNGKRPMEKSRDVLEQTKREALALVSKDLVKNDACLTLKMVMSALDILRGGATIAYPMGLPPHDPIRSELENTEDLSGTQASLEVMDLQRATLWFSGKELKRGKTLADYLGKNEKTKVIVKLQKSGSGPPAREPALSADEQKALMMHAYRRQEELKKLDEDDSNEYHNSKWASGQTLKSALQGLENISFRPK